jgi:hypothetical protein
MSNRYPATAVRAEMGQSEKKGTTFCRVFCNITHSDGQQEVHTDLYITANTTSRVRRAMLTMGITTPDWKTFTFTDKQFEIEKKTEVMTNGTPVTKWEVYAPMEIKVADDNALSAVRAMMGGVTISTQPVELKPPSMPPPPPVKASTPPPPPVKAAPTRDSAWKVLCVHAEANNLNAGELWQTTIAKCQDEFGIMEDQFTSEQWSWVESQFFPA